MNGISRQTDPISCECLGKQLRRPMPALCCRVLKSRRLFTRPSDPAVDQHRTTSNDICEVFQVLGIEAVRKAIENEMQNGQDTFHSSFILCWSIIRSFLSKSFHSEART
jgi:hypothetical protein